MDASKRQEEEDDYMSAAFVSEEVNALVETPVTCCGGRANISRKRKRPGKILPSTHYFRPFQKQNVFLT